MSVKDDRSQRAGPRALAARDKENDALRSKLNTYDAEKALRICELVADGLTVVEITARPDMPSRPTLYRWLTLFPEFYDAYERAREISAQSFEDEALRMARTLKDKNDFTGTKVQAYNIAMQQLRWSASRRDPGRYGQKTTVNTTVPVQINTTLNLGQSGPATQTTTSVYTLEATVPVVDDDGGLSDLDTDPENDDSERQAFDVPEVQRHEIHGRKRGAPTVKQRMINKGLHKSERYAKAQATRLRNKQAKLEAEKNGRSSISKPAGTDPTE